MSDDNENDKITVSEDLSDDCSAEELEDICRY